MKLHLPVFLRKSLLSCLSAFIVCTVGSGAAWAEAQNLTCYDSYVYWDTWFPGFVDEYGYTTAFAQGDNVSFTGESDVTLGEDIAAGTLAIEQGAAVAIDLDVFELNVDRIELSGMLDMGYSLHIGEGTTLAVQSAGAVLDSNLVLGDKGGFEVGAAASLNNNLLTLQGNTSFTLTAAGDGKTYTLLSGVSGLLDAQGNAISLDDTNNAASLYFDATRPGTGFWANGTLQLNDGALQMVLHNETVKEVLTITSRVSSGGDYQYYKGISFENISSSAYLAYGGAIDGRVTMTGNGDVSFSGNTAESSSSEACGGAIDGSAVTMTGNGDVSFSGNTASASSSAHGGAIYGDNVTLSNNGIVDFNGNTASATRYDGRGGAIYGYNDITLSNNGSVVFEENTSSSSDSSAYGGAIYGTSNNTFTLSNNGSVVFEGNTASSSDDYACGGAIYGPVTMTGNGDVSFSGNTAYSFDDHAFGGAIDSFDVTMTGNGSVTFIGNTASGSFSAFGGAIDGSDLTMTGNGDVSFSGNTAESSSSVACGGAICGSVMIELSNNGSVTFIGNTASGSTYARGGAIYNSVTMIGNGDVSFRGNTASGSSDAAYGGAICGFVTMEGNGSVTFIGNTASGSTYAYGGAIYREGDLSIRNNDSVEFYQNAEVTGGVYRLRSIYAGGSGDVISLSASAGKSITFRDSIYIGSYSTFKLNEDYTYLDEEGVSVTVEQKGDIIFTGATTVDDLYTVKGNVAGTEEEIINSRTTEVYALTELHGGRLRVEEGAVYKGNGITAMEDSAATVRVQNATLSHEGYDLTFNAGTTLEVLGDSFVSGNVILNGATLSVGHGGAVLDSDLAFDAEDALWVDFSEVGSATSLNHSSLSLQGGTTLQFTNLGSDHGRVYDLFTGVGSLLSSDGSAFVLNAANNNISNYFDISQLGNLFSSGGILQLSENGTLQLVRYDEAITITTRQENPSAYQYYAGVRFADIEYTTRSSDVGGGAIYGDSDSTITLSNNGSVVFEGNTDSELYYGSGAYVSGGAIYGDNIDLSDNGSVAFRTNTALISAESSGPIEGYARGGAIYGDNILLSENREVSFEGNVAYGVCFMPSPISLDLFSVSDENVYDSCVTSCGGAIYGKMIELREAGRVMFSGNTTYSTASSPYVYASSTEAYASGGAIYGSTIELSGNESVEFSGNTASSSSSSSAASYSANAYAYGGAIYGNTIELSGNESVEFSGNTASSSSANSATFSYANVYAYGGAIYGYAGDIVLSNNGRVRFEANEASSNYGSAYGGAIYRDWGAGDHSVILHNNRSVEFLGNKASSNLGYAYGGAIYGESASTIALSNNGKVTFSGNTADYGGAIYGDDGSTIVLSNNDSVTFSGNNASYYGAVYGGFGSTIELRDNGEVSFGGNVARDSGGAIYVSGNLSIRNNESVLFEQNAEITDGIYRLRSIVGGGNVDVVSLSAVAGKSIEFRDSVYITSGSTVNLNEDYTYLDEEGVSVTVEQKGDIVFTGATTVDDLYTVKGNVAGTEEEIRLSRTTEVNTLTNLYGGRLRVEDGAIYQGQGITAHAGSDATVLVKDATLSHSGYDLTFNAGTTLELAGANSITGNVQIHSGSTLLFCYEGQQKSVAAMTLSGVLNMAEGAIVQLKGYENIRDTVILISLEGASLQGWNKDKLTLIDEHGSDMQDTLVWWDNVLYYTHAPSEHQYVTWANATGDGKWNNMSANWEADGENYAWTNGVNVIFDGNRGETVTLEGDVMVRSMQVTNAGNYQIQYGNFASLTVNETLQVDSGSSVSLGGTVSAGSVQNAGNLSVKGDLTVQEAVSSSGSLEVDGTLRASSLIASSLLAEVLTLTDATATNRIGGNVTLSGAATVAGTLEVSGSFTSGAVQVKKLMADGTVSTGAISSSDNSLTATGNMTTGAVTGDRNELTSTGGYVLLRNNAALNGSSNKLNAAHVVQVGTITGDGNELVAGKHVDINGSLNGDENSITCNATVNTTDNAIDISGTIGSATNTADDNALYAVRGNIRTGAITGSGNTLTAQDGNITTGAITGNDNVLSAVNGVVTAGAIAGTGNVVTAKSLQAAGMEGASLTLTDATATNRIDGNVTLSGAATVAGELTVSGSFNSSTLQVKSLTADGSITTGKLTGDSATLTALNGNIELTNEHESLNGNSNVITATGGDVRLTDDMTGSRNIITAKAVDGVGGSILRGNGRALWASIAGQHNELTADGRIELESINQGNNTLIAGGAIVNDGGTISINSINGSTNTLTATNGSIRVGNIGNATKSDNNRLTAAGHVYVQGQLTGDGNYLESNKAPGDGNSISIWNGINGSGNRILANAGNIAMGGGDLTGDNNTLTSVNGNVSVRNVSGTGNTLSAVNGSITAASIAGAGNVVMARSLTASGGVQGATLTLTDAAAANTIGGNVALSGAATVAGALQVTGALAAEGTVSLASTAEITGDMSAAALVLNAGASLDVGGTLSAAQVTLKSLSATAPTLTVGSFAAGDTIFTLDGASLNALNLGHGESVVIARADSAIGSGFNAWLTSTGSTSLDAAVYRYDISVSGADVLVSMDYANWGTRVWYEGAWVGKEGWSEYMIAGYDAVNGVETVDLGGESIQATNLFLAQEDSTSTSVLSNGSIEAAYTEIVEGNLTIAEDASLDSDELRAAGHDILLQGELIVNNGSIGTLSGTTGTLVIGGEVSVDSNVTLGILDNSGTLDIGSHKLNVAAVVSNGGNVTAGEVVVHNRYGNPAEFDTLVADKVTVTNTSSKYPDYLSVGDGSVIGELVADKLEVREGTATLGSTAKQTQQELQSIALQKGADLVLQGQTSLGVTDTVAMTAGSEVQIQSGSTLQNGAVALSAAPGTAAAQLSSKASGDLVMMQQAGGLCIQDVLMMNTSISAAEGTEVMLSGVEGSENVHLLGGADFSLTFANNKANVGMAVIENSSPVTGITLSAGSTLTLVMDPTNNDFRDYNLVINMSGFEYEGGSLAATGGITDLNAAGIYLGGWLGELLAGQGVVQEGVGNLESPEVPGDSIPTVSYTYNTDNNVGMIISIHGLSVPEPTTTTLSLLSLCALAARRRRR